MFDTAKPLDAKDDALALTLRQVYGTRHTIGRFRIWATTQAPAPRELPPGIRAILAIESPAWPRDAKQREELASYFRPALTRLYRAGQNNSTLEAGRNWRRSKPVDAAE